MISVIIIVVISVTGFLVAMEFTTNSSSGRNNQMSTRLGLINQGPPTFSFVGAKEATITGSPGTTASGSFQISTNSTLPLRLFVLDFINGTWTVPDGTDISAKIANSDVFHLQSQTDPFNTSDPLVVVPRGGSVITYTIAIPLSSPSGTFHFYIAIYTYRDNSATFMTYASSFGVTLIVKQ
jgi:hypothetical protein